ncbi:hypothetical protein Tco_0710201 [Tanacetum coccineum]
MLKWYGYATDEDTTDEDTTDEDTTKKDTTDKNTTYEDTIDESYFPKSKGKNVQKEKKPTLKFIFKSHIPIKGCVFRPANVQTWGTIVKIFGIRNPGNCADTRKGKRKAVMYHGSDSGSDYEGRLSGDRRS